jgi:uncharacterized protein (TIGR02001 family)
MLKQTITAAAAASAVTLCSTVALAEDAAAPAAPPPPYTLTANVNLVSDYYFSGLTQTWNHPAIQGGFDFTHSSGVYLGTWASNVSSNQFPGGSTEWDLYGGYNYKINDDFTVGIGGIYYYYPGATYKKAQVGGGVDQSLDTGEINLMASWKWLTFKWSYALTDYFGASKKTGWDDDTKGTMYFDLTATFPLPVWEGLSLVGHVGYTDFSAKYPAGSNGETNADYWDYKVGVTKTWDGGWNAGLFYVGATNKFWENVASLSSYEPTRDLNKDTIIVQVGRTF